MITLKNAFAAGLALLALPALAQTYAQAEDRPGRYVLVPMSVQRPAGDGWTLVQRAETDLIFIRQADKRRNGQIAVASAKVPPKRVASTAELAESLREELHKQVDNKRFKVLREEIRPDPAEGRKCVRYRQRTQDLGATGPDGKAQIISLFGVTCLHPADEGIVLAATLSARGPAEGDAGIAEEANQFFAGVQPHQPVSGTDWRKLADQGDANAQVWLAHALIRGKKMEEAVGWMRRAAEKSHPEGQTLLGMNYFSGQGVDKSAREAVKWLRLAAEQGYPKAQGLLGLALITSEEVRDVAEGLRWVRKAAAEGDPTGQSVLGELLVFGKAGVEKNEAEGATWYRKAAEQGQPNAQYTLARLFAQGIGVKKNAVQSNFWLGLAAAQGHPDARKVVEQMKKQPGKSPDVSK